MGKFRAIAEGFRKAAPESISGITRDSLKADAQASWDALDGTIGNRDLYTRGNTPAVRGKWDTSSYGGIKQIGQGRSKSVFEDESDPSKVLVRMQRNAPTEAFLDFAQQAHASNSPYAQHLPNVSDLKADGDAFTYRADRLNPNDTRARIGRENGDFYLTGLDETDPQRASLLEAARAMKEHLDTTLPGSSHYYDLHPDNLMRTKDGRLIINDPTEGGKALKAALLAAGVGGAAYAGASSDADAAPILMRGARMGAEASTPEVERAAFDLFKRHQRQGGGAQPAQQYANGLAKQASEDGNAALAEHYYAVASRLNGDDYKNYKEVGHGARAPWLNALAPVGATGLGYAALSGGDNADAAPLTPYGAPNAQFDQQLINKANAPQISAGPTDSEYLGNVVSPALEGLSQLWSRPIDAGQNFIRAGKSVSPYIRHLRNDPSALGGDILEVLDQTGALGFARDVVDQNRYGGAATDAFAGMDLAGAMRDEALAQALLKKRKH